MTALRLAAADQKPKNCVGRIGGTAQLRVDTEWPRCRLCDDRMVAYFEIRIPKLQGVPFRAGSRLQAFACRGHDDIAGPIYGDYAPFSAASQSVKLPENYWDITDGHYLLRLMPPAAATYAPQREARLVHKWVAAPQRMDETADGFKLFGEPFWLQDPETHACACGAPMKLLLQVPENYGFDMSEGAPEQPNSFSRTQYCLFLGNQLYLLACVKQCHPLALWPVLQN
jgi:hypothetical protein